MKKIVLTDDAYALLFHTLNSRHIDAALVEGHAHAIEDGDAQHARTSVVYNEIVNSLIKAEDV